MNPIPAPRHVLVACLENPAKLLTALPVFPSLREAFPQARITALVDPAGRDVVGGYPALDAVEVVEAREGVLSLSRRLRALQADAFLNLYPRSRPLLAARLAGIPVRVGANHKWHGFLQTHTVRVNRAVSDRNEVEYNFEFLKPLGVARFAPTTGFPVGPAERDANAEFLESKGIAAGTPYVIVHPGSRGRALHWKAERYGQLLGHLCQVKGLRVVLTSAPGDGPAVSEATAGLFMLAPEQRPVPVETGDLGLRQLAALCGGALCVLSGPLGPMQLAAAVGTPTVTIFPPAPEATPVRWGAWGNEGTALVPKNPRCNDCQAGYCRKHDPMEALSVMEVLEAVLKFVRRRLQSTVDG